MGSKIKDTKQNKATHDLIVPGKIKKTREDIEHQALWHGQVFSRSRKLLNLLFEGNIRFSRMGEGATLFIVSWRNDVSKSIGNL